ncbi:MAG: HEAT repeat domain-containing protein, partial [bacterium]
CCFPGGRGSYGCTVSRCNPARSKRRFPPWRCGDPEQRSQAREALAGAMRDPEPLVRGAAAWALGRFQGDETARGVLSNALAGESHPQVREEITGALREMEIARPG